MRDTYDIYNDFEASLREAVDVCISDLGGYEDDAVPMFHLDGHYRRIKQIFERVQKEALERYDKAKPPRQFWPYNDRKVSVKDEFTNFHEALMRMVIPYNDFERNELIEKAGGQRFCREKYEDTRKHGCVVVEADVTRLEKNTGLGRRTVFDRLKSFTEAGVLVKLNTTGKQKALYVIGDWQRTQSGGYRPNWRLHRQALRKELKAALIKHGFLLNAPMSA